jgi:hypothetical protein
VETQAFALSERTQDTNSGPEPVGRLGHQHEKLALNLSRELAGIRAHTVWEFSNFSHTRYVRLDFVTPLPWRNGFIRFDAWFSGVAVRQRLAGRELLLSSRYTVPLRCSYCRCIREHEFLHFREY